jgi:RHS repeat-associated protein
LATIAHTEEGKRLSAYLGSSVVDGGVMNLDSITRPDNQPAEPVAPVSQTIQRIHYYQNDQLGTPRELTNAEGEIAWSATYQAWGNTLKVQWAQDGSDTASQTKVKAKETLQSTDLAANDPVNQPVRFQGQYFDSETGLHYNRFRYYDPDVGRFVSQDPIGLLGGDNLYSYARNPTGWVDPFGLNPLSGSGAGRKPKTKKPNIDNRCDGCKKWSIDRYDKVCQGHVPGVGVAKYFRDPKDGSWYSVDLTGHGNSAFKQFELKGQILSHTFDLDEFGDRMSKHKGDAGKTVDLKTLKCKDANP